MWVFLNDAMLSIVRHNTKPEFLHIRARLKGDLKAAFPGCRVVTTPGGDYRYRTTIRREEVAAALSASLMAIDYTNFKNSVSPKDKARKDWYHNVWQTGWNAQEMEDRR